MLPNHILWLLREFTKDFPESGRKVLGWGEILIYANSCTNPIVYSICIEEFRLAFKAYITKCCRVTEEDIRPVRRVFERISIRERSASANERIFARHLNRRLRGSLQRNQSLQSRDSVTKIFTRSNTSRTLLTVEESRPSQDRILTLLPKTESGRNTPKHAAMNGNSFTTTAV